jgi:hypothetical protein
MALHDANQWLPEFDRWATTHCSMCDRAFGGVACLHVAFCEWCARHGSVPCTRIVFEHLLIDQGFLVCDGLVSSLVLTSDLSLLEEEEGRKKRTDEMNKS